MKTKITQNLKNIINLRKIPKVSRKKRMTGEPIVEARGDKEI